ncbi:MAG: M1 family aminopeptidase [Chitinophagaceae bacterium]
MKYARIAFIATLLFISQLCFADNYPRNYAIDIQHYSFALTLSDNSDEIIGETTIQVLFKTGDSKRLRLDFINRTPDRGGKGMIVEAVIYENNPITFEHQKDVLYIDLPKKFEQNSLASFTIKYRGIPADGLRIGPNKYGERCFFNENWPNRTRHWLPTVDHPYDKASNEFIVKAPTHYQAVSNGLLIEESIINKDQKLTHWKQSVPISSWLFVLGVARFAVQHVDYFNGKQIQTWVYPQDRQNGFYDFAYPSKEVLEFYSSYIGPFAYEKLANIQSPSVSGGMETASAIFYGENLVNGKRDNRTKNVVIHEIAHQWFGNAVTETTWDDAWLSEGFATYFTMLFQENTYGESVYIDELKKARTRIFNFYNKDTTYKIIDNRTAEEGPVTNDMTYQKGAWFLHMLRNKMGHEAFRNGIRSYYKKYFNNNASTGDLIAEMEKFSASPLQPFFYQWLHRPDILKINGSWKYNATSAELEIKLDQMQGSDFVFDMPVEIELIEEGSNSKKILTFTSNSKSAVFKVSLPKKPIALLPDPRTVLLAKIEMEEL